MAILTSKKPSATYKSLLNIGTADNQELDGTLRIVEDGAGNDSSLKLTATGNTYGASFNGRVGMGTDTPNGALHIIGPDGAGGTNSYGTDACLVMDNGDASDDNLQLQMICGAAGIINVMFGDTDDNDVGQLQYHHGTNTFNFRTNGSSDRLVIDNAGNVGIGTSSPSDNLEVSSANPTIRLNDTDGFYATIAGSSGSLVFKADAGGDAGGESIQFWTGGGQRVHIDAAGDVGIGTDAPAEELHISATEPTIRLQDSDGTNQYINFYQSAGTSNFLSRNTSSNGSFNFIGYNGSASTTFMAITDAGNVGIGKTPSSKLDIKLSTEDLEIVDAGSASATEQDWIEVEVGGVQGYIRVYATK